MVTNYGKILRKLRIDFDELLKDMAEKVEVSSAYLSAVENGNKSPSENLTNAIIEKYNMDEQSENELRMASKEDVYSSTIQINLKGRDVEQKNVALSFARKFDSLNEQDIKALWKILCKDGSR